MLGDLHCHTRFSDGSSGIDELVLFGKRCKLDFISVTDHDTLAGCKRASVLGSRIGINVVSGTEVSCTDPDNGREVHILCYLPQKPQRLEIFMSKTIANRNRAGIEMCKKVMKDFPITAEQIIALSSGSKAIYKIHIIRALMELGYDNTVYGNLYKYIFKENKDIYGVPIEYPSVYSALDYIKLSGGISVLAHPSTYNSLDLFKTLSEEKRIQGVELFHPSNTQSDMKIVKEYADSLDLICTGGSDFHGSYSSNSPNTLGSFPTEQKHLEKLYALSKSMG